MGRYGLYDATRGLMTLAAAGIAGLLLWAATRVGQQTDGRYWAELAIIAGAGLVLGLSLDAVPETMIAPDVERRPAPVVAATGPVDRSATDEALTAEQRAHDAQPHTVTVGPPRDTHADELTTRSD